MPDVTVSGNVDTMMRAADNAAIRSAIGLGQTDAPTFLAQTLTGQSLTGTQATSLVNLAATWDTTGTPSLIYARVTTTNANNNAKLLDLGTFSQGEVFSVNRYGGVYSGDSVSVATGSHMSGTTVGVGPTGRIGFSSNLGSASTFVFSTGLYQDAAGILAQRNGTAKQALRVYNTFLGTTANEWGGFDWLTTTNTLRIGTEHGGTGTARPIDFVTGGVVRMSIAADGRVNMLGVANVVGQFQLGNAAVRMDAIGSGYFVLSNVNSNDFNRIALGGQSSAYPAIKRNGATLEARLADDSAYASFNAQIITGVGYLISGSTLWRTGTGSPEGVYTAPVGSIFSRTDGSAGTSFYVKESGTGNTGWVAK